MCPRIAFITIVLFSLNATVSGQVADYDTIDDVIRSENEHTFEQWLSSKALNSQTFSDEIYRVPMVVHVLNQGEPVGEGTNISYEQIFSQIRVLNEDFRRKEGTRGFNTNPDGGDARIEFVLAKTSPDGLATDGIVRVDINSKEPPPFGGMIALGAYYSIWDPNDYLNIWVLPAPIDILLGQARFPVSDLPGLEGENDFIIPGIDTLNGIPVEQIDGIAINTYHFGETNLNSKYNLGRTGIHEIGHFLGLFHIWGSGAEGSCVADDYCDDTPPTNSRTGGCPDNKLACDGSRAMIENYMDYTDDECMNIFTNDQILRMRTVLENSPRRKSLLTSKGLFPPDNNGVTGKHKNDINVYPNPAGNHIFIEFSEPVAGKLELDFYDLSGMLIRKLHCYGSSQSIMSVNIPDYNGHAMIIKIITEDEIITKKIFCY